MDQVAEFARVHLRTPYHKHKAESKPDNLKDKHTGFYCFKCKRTVFPATYKIANFRLKSRSVKYNKRRAYGVCKNYIQINEVF